MEPAETPTGFWPQTWEILVKLERGWRFALYYLFIVLVGVAAVAAVGLFIATAAGFVPLIFDDAPITGPAGALAALAAAVVGFLVATAALAITILVLYGIGFFLFALVIFVVCVVLVGLSPILAPVALLGFGIWWFAVRRKPTPPAPPPPQQRVEPTLAE
jgi:hypothetical protein